jgi:hypothetical protein
MRCHGSSLQYESADGDLIRNLEKVSNIRRFGQDPEVEINVAISNVIFAGTLTEIPHGGQLITRSKGLDKLC